MRVPYKGNLSFLHPKISINSVNRSTPLKMYAQRRAFQRGNIILWEMLRSWGYFVLDLCGFVSIEMTGQGFYMSALKNGVLLRNIANAIYE